MRWKPARTGWVHAAAQESFKAGEAVVFRHFEAMAPLLRAAAGIFVIAVGALVTVFFSLVAVAGKLATILSALVAVFSALATVGAKLVAVLAKLVTVAAKDVGVPGNFVAFFQKIGS